MVQAFGELCDKGLLIKYTRDSLMRVGIGYALAVGLGLPIGLLMGWFPRLQVLQIRGATEHTAHSVEPSARPPGRISHVHGTMTYPSAGW